MNLDDLTALDVEAKSRTLDWGCESVGDGFTVYVWRRMTYGRDDTATYRVVCEAYAESIGDAVKRCLWLLRRVHEEVSS